MLSSQKQRYGHITTINHTSVLSGTPVRVWEREIKREWTSTNLLAPSRQAPGSSYLINYSNASFPFPSLLDITGRHRVFTWKREMMAVFIAKAIWWCRRNITVVLRVHRIWRRTRASVELLRNKNSECSATVCTFEFHPGKYWQARITLIYVMMTNQ